MRLLPLPTDRARSPAIYRGASEALALSSDLARAFDRIGNSTHEDIVSTLLSAFAVLVHRYCHEDVLVGVPLSTANPDATGVFDRSRSDLLPIRVRMADDPEAGAVVERVRTALRQAGTEPGLVSTSAAQRDPFIGSSCIATCYQVAFDYWAALPDGRISAGLEGDRAENGANAAGEELSMRVAGGRGGFDGRIDYNAELFEATTIRRMAAQFLMLLRGMLENPEKRISMLPLLTAGEREQLLTDWNRPAAAGPSRPRKFLHEAFESQVAQTPEAIAIIAGSERLTYRDLDAEANKFANYLRERRVGADVLVGISLERSPKLVIALLGILKAGGAYVPLEPSYPPAQLKTLVEQVQPALIVTQQRFLPHHTCSRITTLLLDSEQAAIDASASASPGVRVTGDNLATVIFSSGSTGMPKAIAQRHAAMAHDPRSSAPFEIRASDRHVLKTTLDSTLLVREIFWPLLTGGTMVIAGAGKTADVAPLLKVLREERITLITLVPSLLRLLVDSGGLQACTGLRHVACFGEPLPSDLEQRFCDTLSAGLWSYYGTTEAPSLALRRCSRGGVRPLGNLGYPIPSKKVYVLDANLEPAPIGVPGELYAGGPNLAIGYLNEAATANARFVRNPFIDDSTARMYRTGDRVRWREDGSLEFIGRVDDQLKIRGYRVEPAEVESTLLRNPGVREVAVVAKPNIAGENELAAYFVATQQALTIADLRSFIENRLPAYAVPSIFVRMEELPRRPNGKVDRKALPDPERVRPETSEGLIPPRTPVETRLADIWRDVLGLGSVGVNDNFFALGGHSMLAARAVERIERAFGRRLALNAFWYDGGTIAGQAALLGASGNSGAASVLVPIKPAGNKPCLFVAHTIGGNVFHYYALAAALHFEQPVIGLQARGIDGSESPRRKIEDIAADCIAAMRERQPRGPFFIAGYSSGGVVAFEIAQQLAAAGDDVGLLALLDAFGPRARIRRSRWRTKMSRILHPRPRLLQEKVYHAFLHRLRLDNRRQLTKVGEAQRWAHWSYRARPYRGSVLVITARDSSEMVGDPVLGWGNLVSGGARLRLVRATHGSLLQVPTVADVAAMLQAELDAATARSGQAEC